MAKPWAAPGRLARCDKCDKEFEKLLRCARCGKSFYCSRECQNAAWPRHKNICKRPEPEPDKDAEERAKAAAAAKAAAVAKKAEEKKPEPEPESQEEEEERERAVELRRELLRETQAVNAKMVQAMQDAQGDASKFLPQVLELKEGYQRLLVDALQSQRSKRKVKKDGDDEDLDKSAEAFGRSLMKEVITAVLQRGVSNSACVDQLDIANNQFAAGILSPRPPKQFALEDGDLDGFEPAVEKLKNNGFVCVDGLLDDEIAMVIYDECKAKFWDGRAKGAMQRDSGQAVTDSYEVWMPNPARRGASPELAHALRVLFGLSYEIQRHGYPRKLQVPTMARLCCATPGSGFEVLHLDNPFSEGGRELTLVLFLSPGWRAEDGGVLRTYLDPDEDRPGAHPALAEGDAEQDSQGIEPRVKDFEPEAGRCMIFQSKKLWHEMLLANKLLFSLTLFVQGE